MSARDRIRPQWSPPAGAKVTPQGQAQGQHLVEVHQYLRDETAKLSRAMEEVASGARSAGSARSLFADLTMRQNYWTLGSFCAGHCTLLTRHHMLEDQSLFPSLLRGDRSLRPVVEQLEAEHHEVAEALTTVDGALVALISGTGDITEVQRAVKELADLLISHLDYEEAQLVPAFAVQG